MEELYLRAAVKATIETGLPGDNFPEKCPWTFETAMEEALEL